MKRRNTSVPVREPAAEKLSKHEDIAQKIMAEYFREEIMPALKIEGKAVASFATEGVGANLQKGFQDFNFLMEDDSIKHFEFQKEAEESLTKADLLPLCLSPLMGGKIPQRERIMAAYDITRKAIGVTQDVIQKVEAVIYIMADKFLDAKEMKQLKEELKMTKLGQMLYEDGRCEGRLEGGMQMLIMLVKKGILKLKDAAEQVNMSEADFEEQMKESQT